MESVSVPQRGSDATDRSSGRKSSALSIPLALSGTVRTRLLLILASVLIPILIAQSFIYLRLWEMRRDQEYQSNLEMARAVGVAFQNFVNDVTSTELALGNSIAWHLIPANEDPTDLLSASLANYPPVDEISWISPQGKVLFSTEAQSVSTDVQGHLLTRDLPASAGWRVSAITQSTLDNQPRFAISRAIRDETGLLLGLVMATVEPARLSQTIQFPRAAGGTVALTDSQGRMVYQYPQVETSWELRDWLAADPSLARALAGEEMTALTRSVDGKEVMAARSPVRDIGWVAVASRPTESAMWPVLSNVIWAPLLFLGATGLGLFLSLLIAESVSRPLARLERHARMLAGGRLHLRTSNDGGPIEVIRLADTMNKMAAELQRQHEQVETDRALLQGVVDQMPAGVIVAEAPSGKLIRSNRRIPELFGHPFLVSDHTQEHSTLTGFHPDGRPYTPEEWPLARSATTGEVVIDEEIEILRQDGSRGTISASSAPILNEEGNIIAAVVIDQDITERKRLEKAVHASEQKYRSLFTNMSEAIVLYQAIRDENGVLCDLRYLDANPAYERTMGVRREDRIGTLLSESMPSEVVNFWAKIGTQILETGEGVRLEYHNPILRRWDEVHGYSPANGLLAALFTDIGARKRAEAERERLLAELDATIDSVAGAVIIYAPDGTIVRMNPEARRLFGYTPDQEKIDAASRLELARARTVGGEPFSPDRQPLIRALRGERVAGELGIISTHGGTRDTWVSTSAAPIYNSSGELLGVVGVTMDLSELHRLQERERDLLRAVSHDLKTPITAILGHAQMIGRALTREGQHPRLVESADAIAKSSRRMTAMINELSESARLESGQVKIETQPVELNAFVNEFLQCNYQDIPPRRLRGEAGANLPVVRADPNSLERILGNLVGNALKYSPDDTPIVVRTEARNGEVVVSITDNGQGITEQDLPHLFERFYRAQGAQNEEGLGLGLYITRLLVEAHGGRIWAESQKGMGSRFSFSLAKWSPA